MVRVVFVASLALFATAFAAPILETREPEPNFLSNAWHKVEDGAQKLVNGASTAVGIAGQGLEVVNAAQSVHAGVKSSGIKVPSLGGSKGGRRKREEELAERDLLDMEEIEQLAAREPEPEPEFDLSERDVEAIDDLFAREPEIELEDLAAREPSPSPSFKSFFKKIGHGLGKAFKAVGNVAKGLVGLRRDVEDSELVAREPQPEPSFKSFLGKIGGFAKGLIGLRRDVEDSELVAREPQPEPSFKSFLGKIGGFAKGLIGLRRDVDGATFDDME